MSLSAIKWAKRQRIRHACWSVLVVLADHADKHGRCWPSQTTIAAEAHLAVRTVRLALAELSAGGVISRQHRGNGSGGRASDLITLHLDRDVDLIAAAEATRREAEMAPAEPEPVNSYRQMKDGLAASDGHLTGKRCQGKNLPRTLMNHPSRGLRVQDRALPGVASSTAAGDRHDGFGPASPRGGDWDAWFEFESANNDFGGGAA